jgi:hypothetical protein
MGKNDISDPEFKQRLVARAYKKLCEAHASNSDNVCISMHPNFDAMYEVVMEALRLFNGNAAGSATSHRAVNPHEPLVIQFKFM